MMGNRVSEEEAKFLSNMKALPHLWIIFAAPSAVTLKRHIPS